MEYEYKISNFYTSPSTQIVATTDNVSNIVDKMIRVTSKCTEHYAGDILYEMDALEDAIKRDIDLDRVLFFREGGVSSRKVDWDDTIFSYDFLPRCIQAWRLTHDAESNVTTFRRVDLVARWNSNSDYVGTPT